jgi:hypothetical protein
MTTLRVSLLGLLGAAALGLSAVSAAPAQAQGLSITIGEPHAHRAPPPVYREHRRHFVPIHRHRRVPPSVYATGSFGPPHCMIRTTRHWNGFGWVERRRRICR